MAKPWENYKIKKAAEARKAADKVRDGRPRQDPLPIPGPYPQHAKLYPHTQTNWEIREFWHFLAAQGLSPLSWDELDDQLLVWRGVDKLEYLAEAADMRSKYRWLWEKYESKLPEIAAVIDETKMPENMAVLEPEPTKENETPVPDPAQALLDKIRSARK